jgi:putative drug exporter of the RND superfamily
MAHFLFRLGRASVRRRRLVLVLWIVAAVGAVALGRASGGSTSDGFSIPGVESQQAVDLLERDFASVSGTSAQVVFSADQGTLADPTAAAAVEQARAAIATQPDVSGVGTLHASADGRVGYLDVQYDRKSADIKDTAFDHLDDTARSISDGGVVTVELGGELPSDAVQPEFGGGELIGIGVAVIVLLVAFGSIVAMGVPIGLALVGLATSLGLITLVASMVDVNQVAPTIAIMIGLGVGIDYALFIVTRHREHLMDRLAVDEAAGRSIATSGAAVLFAGITVVIAICGLAIAGIPMVTTMGLMSGLTVLVMVALALTLLPAMLGFAGPRILGRRTRSRLAARTVVPAAALAVTAPVSATRETVWHRWGRQVAAHPWRWLVVAVTICGLLTAPLFGMRLGMTDNGTMPESLTTRRAYDLLATGFGPGFNGPLLLAVELDGAPTTTLDGIEAAVRTDPGVQTVEAPQVNDAGTTALIRVIPTTSPQNGDTTELVHRLRDDVLPQALAGTGAAVHVGGQTAMFIDLSDQVSSRLPWFIGAVIVLSVLLLMIVFRSIAVPLKAAAMNLLSIGGAYGVIVAVFQWGWLSSLIGVHEKVPIVSFMPMMLFAILFGLSMDYEVFLLSRIREEYVHGRDNNSAVVEGIAATARVITSAALIMISVFAAFVLSDDPAIKMFGVGLATAVLIDATIVRIVLVPATMALLGDRNWWLPRWLDRILPRLDLEAGTTRSGGPAPETDPDVIDDDEVLEPVLVNQ